MYTPKGHHKPLLSTYPINHPILGITLLPLTLFYLVLPIQVLAFNVPVLGALLPPILAYGPTLAFETLSIAGEVATQLPVANAQPQEQFVPTLG